MSKYVLPLLFLVCLTACQGEDDLNSFKSEETSKYNFTIQKANLENKVWTKSPTLVILHFFKPFNDASSYKLEKMKDLPDVFQAIVTEEIIQDDSAFGEKRVITLYKQENKWLIREVKVGWKCHQGRGPQYYSGTFCN